jgi:hypothetical protein
MSDGATITPTPRETRLRLNKMERWYRQQEHSFSPDDRYFFRLAFEYAEKAADAEVLAAMLRETTGQANDSVAPCERGGARP